MSRTPPHTSNALGRETSPYLLRHATQEIRWQPWGAAAFVQARSEDKPLLVSIGYSACHWCHVMAEESFSDPRVIAAVSSGFIPVKVDREERPDVDRAALDALARLGARTGWPVTAFMTPGGEVFAGGSYYPPEPRHGLPGFVAVLQNAARLFRDRSVQAGGAPRRPEPAPPLDAVADLMSFADRLANRLLENLDPVYGGFGLTEPRFLQAPLHQLLWRRHAVSGDPGFGEAVAASLARICGSALQDAVGGGFHRYCVDDAWTVPHFEKMLYDNAQTIELLVWVWRGTRGEAFRLAIEGAVSWAIRDMLIPGAGFAASLAAHDDAPGATSESEDAGRFYRWDAAGIMQALRGDAPFLLSHYEIAPYGDDPAGCLIRTERRCAEPDRLAAGLERLRAARSSRSGPARDDKVMADWNGLMLVSLIEAGSALARRDWLSLARRTFDDLVDRLDDGETLRHCVTGGDVGPPGFLEDLAAMSRAALRLHEAFGKRRYLDLALRWVARLDEHFWDADRGGYCMAGAEAWQVLAPVRTITETSLPSGNGLMIGVLARLHEITGDGRHRDKAEQLVKAFHGDILRHGMAAATALGNVMTLGQFVRIAVSGRPDRTETRELLRAALDCPVPDRMVLGPGSGAGTPQGFAPRAQVCVGTACLTPLFSADALRRLTAPGGLPHAVDTPPASMA